MSYINLLNNNVQSQLIEQKNSNLKDLDVLVQSHLHLLQTLPHPHLRSSCIVRNLLDQWNLRKNYGPDTSLMTQCLQASSWSQIQRTLRLPPGSCEVILVLPIYAALLSSERRPNQTPSAFHARHSNVCPQENHLSLECHQIKWQFHWLLKHGSAYKGHFVEERVKDD